MKQFDPTNWYWIVGGDQTQAYSSARGIFVPAADAAFQAWLADGSLPTNIDTIANLGGVLANSTAPRPNDANVLDAYTTGLASNVIVQAVFKILFNHENRIRTIERALSLNGSPPNITPAQALNAVKALM